jgi:predicted Zn-dependent protease
VTRAAVFALLLACSHATIVPMRALGRDAYSHYLAGRLAMYREDYAQAVTELTAAAAAAPDQPSFAIEQARALAKAKRDGDARTVLAHARATWPEHPQVWLASGELLEKASPGDAANAYRRAIEFESDDASAYLGLARIELAQNDGKAAEATLRALVAKVPSSTDGHYRLAQRLLLANDLQGAVGELRAVLEQDPDHIDARLDLARTLRRLGKLDEAILQTRGAFDRSAQPLDIADELFFLLCEADDRQGAIDLLTLLDDDRSDVDALIAVLGHDLALGRMPEANAVAQRIAVQDAEAGVLATAEIHVATAELDKTGEPLAVADVAAIPDTSPKFPLARRLAASALLGAQLPKRALEELEPARKAAPKDLELAYIAALATADAGAVADARAFVSSLGSSLEVQLVRARFEDHIHDTAGALRLLANILQAHPNNGTALNLAGYLLADSKTRLDEAERMLAHARELAPGDPAVLDSWGWLLLQRGRTREAVRALDRASRFAPREPEIMLHLATAWAADHQPKTAARLLDQAEGLHPLPDVKHRIDALRSTLVIK